MSRIVNYNANDITEALALKQGDMLRLRAGQKPPKAPGGFEWKLRHELESLPPQYEYVLEKSKPATPSVEGKVGDRITLDQGEMPPNAPAGMKWRLEMELESLPPRFQYRLEKASLAGGFSDSNSVTNTRTPAVPGTRQPQTLVTQPQAGDLTAVRQGGALPRVAGGMEWVPTGRVFETFPPQIEYRLEQKLAGDAPRPYPVFESNVGKEYTSNRPFTVEPDFAERWKK